MTPGIAFGAVCALGGGAFGWWLVPWLSDLLLKRAYQRSHAWWWESYRAYRAFRDGLGREPATSAAGEEGALGLWRDDALRMAKTGCLARERACALGEAGLSVDVDRASRGESEQEERCAFSARPWQRAGLAVAGALCGGLLALLRADLLAASALGLCALFMAAAVVCDLRARMLPLECCAAIALAGGAFQASVAGFAGLTAGMVFGVVVTAGCCVANHLMRLKAPVGWGDVRCMAALSLATGAGAPFGFAACYAGAALFSLTGLALRKLSVRDGIPMAPFLATWLLCGAGLATGF